MNARSFALVRGVGGLVIVAGLASISCKSNNVNQSVNTTNNFVSQRVGPKGAVIKGPGGSELTVPPDALATEVELRIGQLADGTYPAVPMGDKLLSPVFSFEPHGLSFAFPVTVKLPGAGRIKHATCPEGTADTTTCAWDVTLDGVTAVGTTEITTRTFSLYALVDSPMTATDPCDGVVSGKACGTGANANVVYDCKDNKATGQSVCDPGSVCTKNLASQPAGCAEWVARPAPKVEWGLAAAVSFNGRLLAVSDDGRLWVSAKLLPTADTDWSEDTSFAAVAGAIPTATGSPTFAMAAVSTKHLYVVGPGGLLMYADNTGKWSKLSSGTTENLRGVTAAEGTGTLYVWIVGDAGTTVVNTPGDPRTFMARQLVASGAAVTSALNSVALCSPFCVAGGAQLGLFHGPNGATWVKDTNTLPTDWAGTTIYRVQALNSTTAFATVSGPMGGHVLSATITDMTMPTTWSSVHSTITGGYRGMLVAFGRVGVVGQNGVAAVRDPTTGMWRDTPTGLGAVGNHLTSLLTSGDKVLAVGGGTSGPPIVLEYVGN